MIYKILYYSILVRLQYSKSIGFGKKKCFRVSYLKSQKWNPYRTLLSLWSVCPSGETIYLKIAWRYQADFNTKYSVPCSPEKNQASETKYTSIKHRFCCILYEIRRVINTYRHKILPVDLWLWSENLQYK